VTKRQPRRIADYLEHILQAIDRATAWLEDVPDAAALEQLPMQQDAVIRCIAVIGEAATKILKADPDFVAQHPDVPWAKMSTMRNRVIHDYFEIDMDIVWSTVKQDLPALRLQLQAIRQTLAPGP
jgi:uncharacterized protein with HEPN domain